MKYIKLSNQNSSYQNFISKKCHTLCNCFLILKFFNVTLVTLLLEKSHTNKQNKINSLKAIVTLVTLVSGTIY